jgi:hypothetical protein
VARMWVCWGRVDAACSGDDAGLFQGIAVYSRDAALLDGVQGVEFGSAARFGAESAARISQPQDCLLPHLQKQQEAWAWPPASGAPRSKAPARFLIPTTVEEALPPIEARFLPLAAVEEAPPPAAALLHLRVSAAVAMGTVGMWAAHGMEGSTERR